MILDITKKIVAGQNSCERRISEYERGDYAKIDRYKRALDLLHLVRERSEDSEIREESKRQISGLTPLIEEVFLSAVKKDDDEIKSLSKLKTRDEKERDSLKAELYLRRDQQFKKLKSFFMQFSRSHRYIGGVNRLAEKVAEVLPQISEEATLGSIADHVFSQYSYLKKETPDSETSETLQRLARAYESKGMYKYAVRFIRKLKDNRLELECGDRALLSGEVLEAVDIYNYAAADKKRYLDVLDASMKKGWVSTTSDVLYRLKFLASPEEKKSIKKRLSSTEEFSGLASILDNSSKS